MKTSVISPEFRKRYLGNGDTFECRAVVFDGSGLGHGVGLCQAGALARARRGDALDAILGAYYPETTVGPLK